MCWADQTKLRGCRGQRARSEKFFSANVWYTVRAHGMCGAERALKDQALPHSARSLPARLHRTDEGSQSSQ
jgi:hypothetical protein